MPASRNTSDETTKEWLNNARKLSDEVEQLKYAKEKAYNDACRTSIGYGDERVQTSKINSSEQKFTIYAEYSSLLSQKIEELEKYQTRVLMAIYLIDNVVLRTLLIARYINCKTWEQIAEDMGYSDKWVKTGLHSKALKALEDIRQ